MFEAKFLYLLLVFTFIVFSFSIGLSFPFRELISNFFSITRFSFAQIKPMIFHVLFWVIHLNNSKNIDLGLYCISIVYDLQPFYSSQIIFKITPRQIHLVLITFFFEDGDSWHVPRVGVIIFRFFNISFLNNNPSFLFYQKQFPSMRNCYHLKKMLRKKVNGILKVSMEMRSFKVTQECLSRRKYLNASFSI